ncbi:MAG: Gfo/Idh/MocA family oxidoreductase [Pseudomonadales bacterium]|nr:Gfo/Idh/MocA family oxidoreductase [Pseudomonadales bacterium]
MKVLVIGYGSIGKKHTRNIVSSYPDVEIAILRSGSAIGNSRLLDLPSNCIQFHDLDSALGWQPIAAVVCSPSTSHVDYARILVEKGIAVFIEKPLSNTIHNCDSLVQAVEKRPVTVQIGFDMRFHPVFLTANQALESGRLGKLYSLSCEVGQYLPDWRPDVDYAQSTSAKAELGGGALLELCHEINYVQALLGFEKVEVVAFKDKVSDLDVNVDDVVNILLKGKNRFGCQTMATIHLDFLQRSPKRLCVVVGSEGTLTMDFISNTVILDLCGQTQVLFDGSDFDGNTVYLDEIAAFFLSIESNAEPITSLLDGLCTQTFIEAIRESSEEGCVKTLSLESC